MTAIHVIVFAPLVGFLIVGLFGRAIGDRASMLITSLLVTLSAVLAIPLFFDVVGEGRVLHQPVLEWVSVGKLHFVWSLYVDSLTAVMLVVVTVVSALVHWYSIGYMDEDPHKPRFFAYLSLFTFAMLMLVSADNLVQTFFGWEGVGLASYLLIGFWFKKPSANAAAIKAFVVNRVGDFGFSLGLFALFMVTGSLTFMDIFPALQSLAGVQMSFIGLDADVLTVIGVLLFVGAMGKSAQIILHTWLPDAMEGPTPVSALIHAATMVTAGVFLVARMSPLYELAPDAAALVAVIGATTAFFAATVGLVQNDIKRVVAYSTCSQLGYMFVAAGVSAYGAAIFHLFTHAFFKALLFLGAGSVIHALHHEQDMRRMGGIRTMLPVTYLMMLVGTLALTGFPGTAGYFSKDAIIESAYAHGGAVGQYAFWATVIAAALTSFYSWRLMFMTFHGGLRVKEEVVRHIHESPAVMMIPLIVLALGALVAGFAFATDFIGEARGEFWHGALAAAGGETLEAIHHVPAWVKYSPTVMMVAGFLVAWVFYIANPALPARWAARLPGLYRFLLNKWYFDELYDILFVRPAFRLGRFLWKMGDGRVIDGLGPDGVARTVMRAGARVRLIQTGYIYTYAFVILIGIVTLTAILFFGGKGV